MAVPLRVTVAPERVSAASGDSPSIVVTIRNTSDIVDHYEIDVTGLPAGGSVRTDPAVTKLRPGETGTVTVHLTVAADPPAAAGEHTLGVVVRSRYRRDVSRCEEVVLAIAPIDQVTLRIEPEVVTGGRFAHYTVAVTNDGNTPVTLRLASTDPERHVAATFEPATLDLIPGASARSTMAVSAPIPWGKEKKRTLNIKAGGTGVTSEGSATFVQRPRFAPGVTRTAGVLGAVLVLAAAIVTAAVIGPEDEVDPKADAATPVVTTAGVAVPGPSAPSAGASAETPSEPPPSEAPPPDVEPRTVELVPSDGSTAGTAVDSERFRDRGITVSGMATSSGLCSDATTVIVRGDAAAGLFLTAASAADAGTCNDAGVRIQFLEAVASVTVTLAGEGDGEMRVAFRNGTASTEYANEKTITADGDDRQGIDHIDIKMVPPSLDPPVPSVLGGPQSIEFTPLATS